MKHNKLIYALLIVSISFVQFSCKKFLEIDEPKDGLVKETIFKNDDIAVSAITGIYSKMAASGFASGGLFSVSFVGGLSSDEFYGYNAYRDIYENELTSSNASLNGLIWSPAYQRIYAANAVLEGLTASSQVTPSVKAQLQGEALFIRAFTNFYLVNLFGPVPLHLSTNYKLNEVASPISINGIYQQIIADLKLAEVLLNDNYVTIERIRPNQSVVQALLARTYLYLRDWQKAEEYATLVINKNNKYSLVNLDAVFQKNSNEAIWQLMPTTNTNTLDGNVFILTTTPTQVSLSNSFVQNAFETGDRRKVSWINSITTTAGLFYYPYKYKVKSSTTVTEYTMVLRLAEQYLIRAESRINQGKISIGIEDLNLIRNRARQLSTPSTPNPLPILSSNLSKEDALTAVAKERRVELFSEWGHRWLDLKRTGKADATLNTLKPKWQSTDILYPIPETETSRNPNIKQNDGY